MASPSSSNSALLVFSLLVFGSFVVNVSAGDLNQDFHITWGDGRAKIINSGELRTLSLDKASGSGFQSKNEYLFGQIDMQLKLVVGNSTGTITTYYCLTFKPPNWLGYVAMTTDEGKAMLGRRDILVTFRGTMNSAKGLTDVDCLIFPADKVLDYSPRLYYFSCR